MVDHHRRDASQPDFSEVLQASWAEGEVERPGQVRGALGSLVRTGVREGDVTRHYAPEECVTLILGSLHQLMLEWFAQPDFPIAARAERLAGLLAEALAPRRGEWRRRRAAPLQTVGLFDWLRRGGRALGRPAARDQ